MISCRNVLIYLSPEPAQALHPPLSLRSERGRLVDSWAGRISGAVMNELFKLVDKEEQNLHQGSRNCAATNPVYSNARP